MQKITTLLTNDNAFPVILKRIKNARESIYVGMFIWRDDNIGNVIAKAILNAANRGVKVIINKDKVGSFFEKEEENRRSFFHEENDLKTFIQRKILLFLYFSNDKFSNDKLEKEYKPKLAMKLLNHPNLLINRDKLNYDHSKCYLIDNKYLIVGGMNIEDRAAKYDIKYRKYADYMIETTNEEVIREFRQNFMHTGCSNQMSLKNKVFYINRRKDCHYEIKHKVINLMTSALYSIDIEMAYWGDKDIINTIIMMANKGINVTIMTSRQANIQNDYNLKAIKKILKANNNIQVYLSSQVIHAKLLCIDKKTLFLGSANFNYQSMSKFSELNVFIDDDPKIINQWLLARSKHLNECEYSKTPSHLKYSRVISFFEGFFC